MALPLAVAAFCVTTAVCHERKKNIRRDEFFNRDDCAFFVQDETQPFKVGEIDMSQFIQLSMRDLPSVTDVSVKTEEDHIKVEVTVDDFDWEKLSPIYKKELDLSDAFRGHSIDFRVIDGSSYARTPANAR